MLGAVRRQPLTAARLLVAAGLMISAGLVSAVGGGWGFAIAGCQAALGVAILLRPLSPGPVGGAILSVIPPPLAAVVHWTARLPGACRCARLPHPPPGLVSETGLAVVVDLALLCLTLWLTVTRRQAEEVQEVGKSPP